MKCAYQHVQSGFINSHTHNKTSGPAIKEQSIRSITTEFTFDPRVKRNIFGTGTQEKRQRNKTIEGKREKGEKQKQKK